MHAKPQATRPSPAPVFPNPQRPGLPPPVAGKNTYSRATQGGSGSGRRASRWRLQSSRSPRQRQVVGHGHSAAIPEGCPSAPLPPLSDRPARPSTAHSSSPNAAARARRLGALIAVQRPLSLPDAPSWRALGARHKLPAEGARPPLGRVRACSSRFPVNSFFYSRRRSPFMPPNSRRETEKNCQLQQSCSLSSVGSPKPLLVRKRNFFASTPRRCANSPRDGIARRGGERSTCAHWPARLRASPRPRDNNTAPAGGLRAGESGAEIVGNSELYFPASPARSLHCVVGNIYPMESKGKRE